MSELIEKNSYFFPKNLTAIGSAAPEVVYLKGKLNVLNKQAAVAIVGTRMPTKRGCDITRAYAMFLANAGITIVSGFARGIDTYAHTGALEVGGTTIAVFGCGLDTIYPPENDTVAKSIIKSGCLISEHEDDVAPKPEYFLARNRIIAGIADCTIVIEGQRRSGTLSTAGYAAEYGREVFALAGGENDSNSQAPNYLIAQGAQALHHPQEVIDYLVVQDKM